MTKFYIEDYGLTAGQLAKKYKDDEQHPGYRKWDWRQVVASDSTQLGYWDWLRTQLMEEQNELDKDSPYNTPS